MIFLRSKAREVALQLLYQYDLNRSMPRPLIEAFVRARLRENSLRRLCLTLFDGTLAHLPALDQQLGKVAENWRLHRMAATDRNVLRLGAFELAHQPETPAAVILNEAIELARRFGSADSPGFVNGVLDRVHHLCRPATLPTTSDVPAVASE